MECTRTFLLASLSSPLAPFEVSTVLQVTVGESALAPGWLLAVVVVALVEGCSSERGETVGTIICCSWAILVEEEDKEEKEEGEEAVSANGRALFCVFSNGKSLLSTMVMSLSMVASCFCTSSSSYRTRHIQDTWLS